MRPPFIVEVAVYIVQEDRMSLLLTVKRAAAGLMVASAIAFAGSSAQAEINRISQHGYWETVSGSLDGYPVTGAMTKMNDGSVAAVLITRGDVTFRLSGKTWNLDTGEDVRVRVVIDGSGFKGRARAINDQDLEVTDLKMEFIQALIDGRKAYVEVNGERWQLNLTGITASLKEAVALYASQSGRSRR